jgi:hypothetical protein
MSIQPTTPQAENQENQLCIEIQANTEIWRLSGFSLMAGLLVNSQWPLKEIHHRFMAATMNGKAVISGKHVATF